MVYWFYLNYYVWLLLFLWYFVLPFCLMNPKGEKNSLEEQPKNSLVQVLQMMFTVAADMIQILNMQVYHF